MKTVLLLLAILYTHFCFAEPPALMLANPYHHQVDLDDYWVSEKLDGVRAYWNGHQLISRQGHAFTPPPSFTRHFPAYALDGELWLGHNRFDELSAIVRAANSNWSQVQYRVFDAPAIAGDFDQRLAFLHQHASTFSNTAIQLVEQWRTTNSEQLHSQLLAISKAGGEGLMLHHRHSLYEAGRSDNLLKLKLLDDAEARVIGYKPGKGKYTGMMGALEVMNDKQQHFFVGSGFSDEQRRHPPAIGTVITYRYNGFTKKGLPRFARFWRVRIDP